MSVAISFRFPAGRYHATPWETHVNEAEIEWPPSAWRVLRALIAVWHRKMDPEEFPEDALARVVNELAVACPHYRLPRIVHAHSRHYMPGRSGKKDLVFDAFGRIDPKDELVMTWPELDLDSPPRQHLASLLDALGYLGRAESWVEARLSDESDDGFDCVPLPEPEQGDSADNGGSVVRLPVAVPPDAYAEWRDEKVVELGLDADRLNKGQKRLLATLPDSLLGALRLESEDVRREGWSRAPGLRYVVYRRPSDTFRPHRRASGIHVRDERSVTTARLILSGKPLPRIEEAVRIGELIRLAAIRKASDAAGAEGQIPVVLSGHGSVDSDHQHAFYLPQDSDGDGRLDHVLVHAPGGLDLQSLSALDRICRIWRDAGNEWRLTLEAYGALAIFRDDSHVGLSRVWTSITPYLHPWYRKNGFDAADQIIRECELRGLGAPTAERLDTISVKGRRLRPAHFHRFRRRRGLRQPDTRGSFWRLAFPEPLQGPLALGFACHFGLGLFCGQGSAEAIVGDGSAINLPGQGAGGSG